MERGKPILLSFGQVSRKVSCWSRGDRRESECRAVIVRIGVEHHATGSRADCCAVTTLSEEGVVDSKLIAKVYWL